MRMTFIPRLVLVLIVPLRSYMALMASRLWVVVCVMPVGSMDWMSLKLLQGMVVLYLSNEAWGT